jgi:glycolate oxidase FAD binding subunit
LRVETPSTAAEAAELLAAGGSVRPRGGGTKWNWGSPVPEPAVVLSTAGMAQIVEHNVGDLTAVLGAGVRLADAQSVFAEAGQMLALDPLLGAATIGGVVATGDSGPLRHRYGAPRDLLLGMTVALSDGSVARSGGKVIKNVAGYDLGKLFAGSFGTLGTIAEVVVRLHPRPAQSATVLARGDDPAALARVAHQLSAAPLELEAFDVAWSAGEGLLLARVSGVATAARAERIAELAGGLDVSVTGDADDLWAAQRERQRGEIVLRVSALPGALDRVLAAAERRGAALVGRAGIGVHWLRASTESVLDLRRDLAPFPCVLQDAPAALRAEIDPWDVDDPALLALSRRVKERFDPAGTCSPGVFVGGI